MNFELIIVLIVIAVSVIEFLARAARGGSNARRRDDASAPAETELERPPADATPVSLEDLQAELRRVTAEKMGRAAAPAERAGRTFADDVRDARLKTRPDAARTAPPVAPPAGRTAPTIAPAMQPAARPRLDAAMTPALAPERQPEVRAPAEVRAPEAVRAPSAVRGVSMNASRVADGTVAPRTRDIVQALIWTEVLGPPRSKRPRR